MSSVLFTTTPSSRHLRLFGGSVGICLPPVRRRGGAACHPFISGEYGGTDPVGVYCGTCTTFSTSASGGRMGGEILPSRCGLPRGPLRPLTSGNGVRRGPVLGK